MRDFTKIQKEICSINKRDFLPKTSKVCNYRIINGKKQKSKIEIIKTIRTANPRNALIRIVPKICSFKNIFASSEIMQKNSEEIDATLRHYAHKVIQPEFDILFFEKNQLQENSMTASTYQSSKIESDHFSKIQTQSICTKNSFNAFYSQTNAGNQLKSQTLLKNEEYSCNQLKELDEDDNQNHANYINNEESRDPLLQKSRNGNQSETSKKDKLIQKQKQRSLQQVEVCAIYHKINFLLDSIQDQYNSTIRAYDFNSFELLIKPSSLSYFTTSIVNIFQSFTKKYRAPYKTFSKQSKSNAIPTNTSPSFSQSSHNMKNMNSQQLNKDENDKLKMVEDQNYTKINNNEIVSEGCSSSPIIQNRMHKIKKEKGNSMRQSKFHNLKKSFMHSLILLFQSDILNCLELSENHTSYLQSIINRMRAFSTKTRPGNCQYEYYSHTHYTALLLKLNQYSIPLITQNENDLQLHQAIFFEDLSNSTGSDRASIKCNFYKSIIYKIIQMSIQIVEKQNNLISNTECETKSVCRFDYILRVKSGIDKLNQGIQITRF